MRNTLLLNIRIEKVSYKNFNVETSKKLLSNNEKYV